MTCRDLSPGSFFRVPGDTLKSLLRRQWAIDRQGNGYNAVFVGGMLSGKPTWIDEDQEVQISGETNTKQKRMRRPRQ